MKEAHVPTTNDEAQRQTFLEEMWLEVVVKVQVIQCYNAKLFIKKARQIRSAPEQLSRKVKAALVMVSWFHFSEMDHLCFVLGNRFSAERLLCDQAKPVPRGWCEGYTMREQASPPYCAYTVFVQWDSVLLNSWVDSMQARRRYG